MVGIIVKNKAPGAYLPKLAKKLKIVKSKRMPDNNLINPEN